MEKVGKCLEKVEKGENRVFLGIRPFLQKLERESF
jgi:hypothetical protein